MIVFRFAERHKAVNAFGIAIIDRPLTGNACRPAAEVCDAVLEPFPVMIALLVFNP